MAEVSSTAIVKYSAQEVLPYFKLQQVCKRSVSISFTIKRNFIWKSSKVIIVIRFFKTEEFLNVISAQLILQVIYKIFIGNIFISQ